MTLQAFVPVVQQLPHSGLRERMGQFLKALPLDVPSNSSSSVRQAELVSLLAEVEPLVADRTEEGKRYVRSSSPHLRVAKIDGEPLAVHVQRLRTCVEEFAAATGRTAKALRSKVVLHLKGVGFWLWPDDRRFHWTVAVIIPAFNREEFIGRALRSCLRQVRVADEIIVVDDGSTDRTAEAAHEAAPQAIVITQENKRQSAARNTGLRASTADFIHFLDSDDELYPEAISRKLCAYTAHPDVQVCYSTVKPCLPDNGPPVSWGRGQFKLRTDQYPDQLLQNVAVERRCPFIPSTVMCPRWFLEEVGDWNESLLNAEDTELWFRMAMRRPRVMSFSQPLTVRHVHHGNLESDSSARWNKIDVVRDFVPRLLESIDQNGPYIGPAVAQLLDLLEEALKRGRDVAEVTARLDAEISPLNASLIQLCDETPWGRIACSYLELMILGRRWHDLKEVYPVLRARLLAGCSAASNRWTSAQMQAFITRTLDTRTPDNDDFPARFAEKLIEACLANGMDPPLTMQQLRNFIRTCGRKQTRWHFASLAYRLLPRQLAKRAYLAYHAVGGFLRRRKRRPDSIDKSCFPREADTPAHAIPMVKTSRNLAQKKPEA
jgi:glycosyltransferase involved in cell wall biosynthesis